MIPHWLRPLGLFENLLRCLAAVILVAGLGSSLLIWRAQDRAERSGANPKGGLLVSPLDDRRQMRDLEYYGGKPAVMMEEAKGLFQGKPLARTIAIASVVLAAGLVLVSVRRTD